MNNHTLQQVIDLAVKTAVLKAKKEAILECRPVGSYFLTETEDDPNVLFGGGWEKLTGRYVLQCSDDSHKAGTTVQAGLPNIKGQTNNAIQTFSWDSSINAGIGAIVTTPAGNEMAGMHGTGYGGVWIDFDASKSNSIYGNSDTVQPPARIVNVWKRVS